MSNRTRPLSWLMAASAILLTPPLAAYAQTQVLHEDFDTVTGTGGGGFLDGSGESTLVDWDDGIVGETAFGLTTGYTHARMSARGNPTAGVGGSGAGQVSVSDLSFDLLAESFDWISGTGGWLFVGDGNPDTSGWTSDWDDGISGEGAFFGTYDGAALLGTVVAQGLLAEGLGQLVVENVDVTTGGWYGGLMFDVPGFPAGSAALLRNASFEEVTGDKPTHWGWWGPGWNVLCAQETARTGAYALKMFGQFIGAWNESGVYQDLPAQEGQTWEIDCWAHHIGGDDLVGTSNYAEMRIEFFDGVDPTPLDTVAAVVLDGTYATDVWHDSTPIQLTAPAGTAYARAVIAFVQPAGTYEGGAAHIDDVSFSVVSGPPAFDLSQFSLTADVRGVADTDAGQTYGHYQLRIEDTDGDRLVFRSPAVADGNWASIGGALNEAEEQDADGTPATAVFNPASAVFTVVVAFENGEWGTGGTLEVDNLLMPNDERDGSEYFAGLFWDDLAAPPVYDPRQISLTADLMGNVAGGEYQLRLEAFAVIPPVEEDFETATGEGVQLVGPDGTWGDSYDWDSGIAHTYAFGGVTNGVVTEPAGGIWIEGATTGGHPGGAAVLEAHEIALGIDGLWYVGIAWRDQALASADLSQVSLTADILGTWNPSYLERASYYCLRIEDPQGDWIGFDGIVTGSWQTIGGLLSTTNASGQGASGDGTFDIDIGSAYTVVVVMESADTADWGGTLTVDNVHLTPSDDPVTVERGTVSFSGTTDGGFQTVGGLLSEGESTWPPVGGCFWPDGQLTDWDRGIEGEEAFAGTWNAEMESFCAEGCVDCGVGGSGGGVFNWSGVDAVGGYMWGGVAWHGIELTTPLDLSQVEIYADVKGTWDESQGQTPGLITVRLEEDYVEARRAFDMPADGTWHTVGGPLSDAYVDGTDINPNAPSYAMVVIIHGPRDPDWGTGGTVEFDNVRVIDHGVTVLEESFETVVGPIPGFLDDAGSVDSYTVTVTMENGVSTWPTEDCPGDLDHDGDIDLSDLAALLANYGMTSGATYEDGDLDGDGDVDLSDLAGLLANYGEDCVGEATLTVDNVLLEVIE